MKMLKILIILFLFTISSISLSCACQCPQPENPNIEYGKADVVFTGKVIEGVFYEKVNIKVYNVLKGNLDDNETIYENGDCSFDFIKGNEYLIYANVIDEKLRSSWCYRTKKLSDATDEVITLNNLKEKYDKAQSNKVECEKQGGNWGRFGEWIEDRCNLPTKDGGNICNFHQECEGDCIAELTKEQERQVIEGGELEISGKSSDYNLNFGCFPFVESGKVKHILCVD